MAAGTGEGEDKDVVFDEIDEQPVRREMALSITFPVAGEGMIFEFRRQGLAGGEKRSRCFQQRHVLALFFGALRLFFKSGRVLDRVFTHPPTGLSSARPCRCSLLRSDRARCV